MASVIPKGSVNLLSGWCGFWDTQSHFHVGVFCILPLFLNHVSTWSCASKAPEPENTEEQTAAQTESTEAENTDLLLTMLLSIYLKPKLSPTYEFFNSCVKTELISVIKCRSINLRHLSIFGLMEWLGDWYVFVVMLIHNHGVSVQCGSILPFLSTLKRK